ncbi:hypothetical protein LSTR_LSTR001291 [Laodelphax striatellus]|uniref:Uncharacterized protein n=1 Tax=Laodelphax striatellus TaxID=195883 RepID=A0A482XBQ3_LAOST|nr:hypothetical protein LSTR_LSTR001291 [Laodelphax striatellus]
MDMKDFKKRYIAECEQLEIEEIFVAAKRHNMLPQGHEFQSSTDDNESTKNKKDEFNEAEAEKNNLVGDEVYFDCDDPQRRVVINDKQFNPTAELSNGWEYSHKSRLQQHTEFQQPTGFQHTGFQQNTGFQQQHFNPTYYKNYNRDALRNRDLNLMTDGVFNVQQSSQRMGMTYDEFCSTEKFREEWEFPANSTNNDIPRDIGNHSLQHSQKLESLNDGNLTSTEILLERWKSSHKSEKIDQFSGENAEKVPENQDVTENNNMTTSNELSSTEILLQKWKASHKSRQEDQLLARDIGNVLKNHKKIISRDGDEKFTLEMEFSPKDLPFNIRLEPTEELRGVTASVEKFDIEGSQASQTSDQTKSKNLPSIVHRNRKKPVENVLNVDIEVVPLTVDQNFSADVDKSVFREQCVRRILKDDHKIKQPVEPVSVVKSGSKNQSRSPIFLRDSPSKNSEELKAEPNTKQSVFDKTFNSTKPNDVLQSWVQMMEGFLEDQKVRLRRKMYQMDQDDELGGNDYNDYERRMKSSDGYDRSGDYEHSWIEEGILEANRMISRTQLYPNPPQSQLHQNKTTPDAVKKSQLNQNKNIINTVKKQGIMKKKKENVATQKIQTITGKNKNSRKGKKKLVEREGPAVYKPKEPVFKPPPPKVERERKSFMKDVDKPIIRSSHGFGSIRGAIFPY